MSRRVGQEPPHSSEITTAASAPTSLQIPDAHASTNGGMPVTPRGMRTPRLVAAGKKRVSALKWRNGLEASLSYVATVLQKAGETSPEELVGGWPTLVGDCVSSSIRERFLVLTSAALYRIQLRSDGRSVHACEHVPLGAIHRVFVSKGRLMICERITAKGTWEKFLQLLTKDEPHDARPWREGSQIIVSRWYAPVVDEDDDTAVRAMLSAIELHLPEGARGRRSSETVSVWTVCSTPPLTPSPTPDAHDEQLTALPGNLQASTFDSWGSGRRPSDKYKVADHDPCSDDAMHTG